jgi:hypothetical protein
MYQRNVLSRRMSVAAGLAVASVVTLAAGCGSSAASVSPPASPLPSSIAPTSSAPATTAPPATTTPTTPPSTAPVEPANLCRLSELSVSAGQGTGAAGTISVPILFRNTGTRTCQLQGWPGVAGLNATGAQVTQAVRTPNPQSGGAVPPAVTLAPGATVSAAVQGSDVPVGTATSCVTYPSLLVTPPGETHSTVVTAALPGCNGLKVFPVITGTNGI